MIVFQKPTSIALDDGRLLFAAITRLGKRIVLTGMYYFDRPIDYYAVRFVAVPGISVSRKHYARTLYEPCVVIVLETTDDVCEINVHYGDQSWRISLPNETPHHTAWSAVTVFKHDYRLIPEYVRYYRALGVDEFRLFYNGPLSEIDWTFLDTSPQIGNAKVIITEWAMPYWWPLNGCEAEPRYAMGQHYAQTMAVNHALHCAKGFSDYLFFLDLDEYVITPRPALEQTCRDAETALMLQCWWAAPDGAPTYADFAFPDAGGALWIAPRNEGHERLKCFVNTDHVDIMGVHVPWQYSGDLYLADGFLHLRGFAGEDRPGEAHKDMRRITIDHFQKTLFGMA